MLYFKLNRYADVLAISEGMPQELRDDPSLWLSGNDGEGGGWINRQDIETFAQAEAIAAAACLYSGKVYLATDAGEGVSPRFGVIEAPAIGDAVSMGFGGDYYPCGTIIRISASLKVVNTSDGKTFTRRGKTGTWNYGSIWSMVSGHREELNPHF